MIQREILIDGPNVYHSLKRLGISKICYKKFKEFLEEGKESRTTFYGSRPADTPKKQLNFLFALKHIGYILKINILKTRGGRKIEKGVDAQIVDDLNTILQEGKIKDVTLVSGDKDYLGTIQKLLRANIDITVISTEDAISPEVRLVPSKFIPLNKIFDQFKSEEKKKAGKKKSK